jgi:hypothetical protein
MNLTPIGALISRTVSPGLIGNYIQHKGVFFEDRLGNISFHHAETPMAQGILESLELIVAADKAGDTPAASDADEEDAHWEIFHSGWPSDEVPDFEAHQAAMAKGLKASRRGKSETALLTILGGVLEAMEKGIDLQTPHPHFKDRTALIEYLADFAGKTGLSRSNLHEKFGQAKRIWNGSM